MLQVVLENYWLQLEQFDSYLVDGTTSFHQNDYNVEQEAQP